ncbi:PepSY domain-containing protein [Amycolatopsis sp. OK19-0408]|uniref:PepSY domain-containing protein n=1 Tax=Amycolatopsis iheyensis TaxID=2945988 RepID=A0A9X2NJS7_9PSEU|nr:PepSY domain-containing protein [Amycolatopsis iheyensis]MCR6486165.1 PepSY domain-containing protein [Amycolatopsis iheyensis]
MRAPLIAGAAALLVATAACSSSTPPPQAHGVDQSQAARIATDKYGGRSLGVEQDTAQGQPSWEVEIADSSQGRIEVDVAQRTGAVLTMERD